MDHLEKAIADRINNPILKEFLEVRENYELLHGHLDNPSSESGNRLDNAFREHFLEIRFTSYILSLIRYASIDFDKKERRNRSRAALILDGTSPPPVNEPSQPETLSELNPIRIEDVVTSSTLYQALKTLTDKEKNVLLDAYVSDMSDTPIAKKNGVSQQAVSKVRIRALQKLRQYLTTKI